MKKIMYLPGVFVLLCLLPVSCLAGGSREAEEHSFSGKELTRLLGGRKDVSIIARAITDTGIAERMNALDGYTLFVPTDEVVMKMTPRLRDALKTDPEVLLAVLTDQMVKGVYSMDQLKRRGRVNTLGGVNLAIRSEKKKTTIGGADLVAADLYGKGFVVHVISGVVALNVRIR